MNMGDIARKLEREINSDTNPNSFPNWVEGRHPGVKDKDAVADALNKSLEPIWVDSHERINKDGGVTLVKGYWKQPKSLMALDVAKLEVRDENGEATGLNIEAELEEYMNALASGAISLGQIR